MLGEVWRGTRLRTLLFFSIIPSLLPGSFKTQADLHSPFVSSCSPLPDTPLFLSSLLQPSPSPLIHFPLLSLQVKYTMTTAAHLQKPMHIGAIVFGLFAALMALKRALGSGSVSAVEEQLKARLMGAGKKTE
jgi:hypothetical protein